MVDLRQTESMLQGLEGFDTWPDRQILAAMLEGQRRALAAVAAVTPDLERAASMIAAALLGGGRIVFAGAGASARVAVMEGAELPATFGLDEKRVGYLIAGGEKAIFETLAEEEDNAEAARRAATLCRPGDVCIAVAASGSTPYTCAAAEVASAGGAKVIAVVNNAGSPLARLADVEVMLDSGPEVISGSTRLGAATAQKAALNLMFCLAFTRAGAVHDGLMVDVVAGNAKLRERACQIVMALTGADADRAGTALAAADWQIKPATLMLKGAGSIAAARALLGATQGNLRQALAQFRTPC